MESINNISTAVSKAIWGTDETTTQEPVSGKTGDVSKGQPYDAGNLEPNEQSLAQTPLPTSTELEFESKAEPKSESRSDRPPSPSPKDIPALNKKTPSFAAPDVDPSSVGPGDNNSSSSSSSSSSDMPIRSKPLSSSAAAGDQTSADKDMPGPSKTFPSSATPGDQTKSQSDTRDPSDPDTDHHASAPKQDVDNTTGGLDVGDNPDKQFSGPGPRPLEVVAKLHGGDAGHVAAPPKQEVGGMGAPLERHDSGHQDDKGDKYVRSKGLVADGGDFDAAKPGAGREADRILDQKGVHREPAAHGGIVPNKGVGMDAVERLNASGTAHGEEEEESSHKEKVSLKTKIKNKLHIGSHSGSETAPA